MMRRFLAGVAVIALPAALTAQATITLRADSTRRVVSPGEKLAVPVILDMSVAAGTNLGSLSTSMTFASASLHYDSVKAGSFGSVTPNTGAGSLTLGVFDATGTTVTQTLATAYFTATSTTGGSTIGFSPTAAGSASGTNILPLMRTRPMDVCVLPGGKWGDVNGDPVASPLGDGNVNVIDAQQIARFVVGLAVANPSGLAARGDVNADAAVNIVDAQQIARYSVGLSAAARVGTFTFSSLPTASISMSPAGAQNVDVGGRTLQLSASARDVDNVDVGYCALITWTSSDPSIATVSSTGVVQGIAAGTTTITASANGQSNTLTVTVKPFAFASLTGGNGYTCGMTQSSVAYCWGNNFIGQIGDGTAIGNGSAPSDGRKRPTLVSGNSIFARIATGRYVSCAWTAVGAAYCWGENTFGQVGDGTQCFQGCRLTPTAVIGGIAFSVVAPGSTITCGLSPAGAAYCWGRNEDGRLGDGTTTTRMTPTPVQGGLVFTALTAADHVCGLTSAGVAYCWGVNQAGQVGDGTKTVRTTPTLVSGGLTFKAIAAEEDGTCGLTTTGAAYCWGQRTFGNPTGDVLPVAVPGGMVFESIVAGNRHACALTAGGDTYCWGAGTAGELGDNTGSSSATPVLVAGGLKFVTLAAGSSHTCGLTATGTAYCWGENANGGLGDGTSTNRLVPIAVLPP
jgi:alpha-tubulin suppressor-like RCC1 family protein